MSATFRRHTSPPARLTRRTLLPIVLALLAAFRPPSHAAAEDQPPHMRGKVAGDGSTPPQGFTSIVDPPHYLPYPTHFEVAFTSIDGPLPKDGFHTFDETVGAHDSPRLYELRSITQGKRFLAGNPAGHWRTEPYFRSTALATCPMNGSCAPEIDATLHAKWGNVRGLVVFTDGTPSSEIFPVTARPAGQFPPGEDWEFNPRSAYFDTQDGRFDFRRLPFVYADPSWTPQCYGSKATHTCEAVPVDPKNEWGLRVVGDGGVDSSRNQLLYSNGPGTFDWKITLSTKLAKEKVVTVRSSEAALVLFMLEVRDVYTLRDEQREMRGKHCGDDAPHPVNLVTGNVFLDHTDAVLPGLYQDLAFTRHYNSMGRFVAGGVIAGNGVLSKGWTHTYSTRVEKLSDHMYRIWQANGVPAYYTDPDEDGVFGVYGVTHHLETLKVVPGGYLRTYRAGGTEEFDADGRLQRLTDRLGRATTLARDARNRLSTITSPEGRKLTLEYDYYDSQIARLVGPAGVIAEYAYDSRARASQVRYADGTGYRYSYDDDGLLTTVTDAAGVVLERHGYHSEPALGAGNPARAAWSELNDGTERHSYAYEDGRTLVTNSRGSVSIFEHTEKPSGRYVTKITGCSFCGAPQAGTLLRDYDDDGRLRAITDADDHTTTYEYAGADLTAVTDAEGRVTRYGDHDQYGRPGFVEEPGGGTTTFSWSLEGPSSVRRPGVAGATSYTYTNQRLSRIDTAAGSSYGFEITPLGELRSTTDSRGKATRFGYDAMGRLETSTLPDGTTTRIVRDVMGRPTTVERADGKMTRFGYDASGRLKERRDEKGRLWRYSWDGFNRMQAVVDPLLGTTRLSFDSMSLPTSVTDAMGRRTSYTYDELGRLIEMVDPMGGREEYGYYPGGRLRTRTDRKGIVTTFSYDRIGRLTGKTHSDGTPPLSIHYDDLARTVTLANGTDTLTRRYDPSGTLASESSAASGSTVSYAYEGGYLRESASLDGFVVSYGYDGDFVKSIESAGRSFAFAYDEQGRRQTLAYPNGLTTTYSFKAQLPWLEGLRVQGGDAPALEVAYAHDAVGNRLGKTVGELRESYDYDPLDRLTSVTRTSPAAVTSLFGYDAVGNRTSQQIAGAGQGLAHDERNRLQSSAAGGTLRVAGTTSEPAVVQVQGRPASQLPANAFQADVEQAAAERTLTVSATDASGNTRTHTYELSPSGGPVAYEYDANGNLTGKGEAGVDWGYEWNAENQLLRVTRDGAEAARFAYDPLGRRVSKIAGGVTTSYVYDGMDILRETVSDGVTSRTYRYLHGPGIDEPLARIDDSGAPSYYHADGLGSIVATTDSAGTVTRTQHYDAWGNPESGSAEPGYAFTGREWDPEIGLYYYRARYYDPKIGRFISEDPIGFAGGVNFYSYVLDAPTKWRDPLGLAIGDYPPPPPGYDPKTWKAFPGERPGEWWLQDPNGGQWRTHPEDPRHWRHWDRPRPGQGNDETQPPKCEKPRPNQKRPPYGNQSPEDPSGDAPPWKPPIILNPMGIYGLPVVPLPGTVPPLAPIPWPGFLPPLVPAIP